MNSRTDLWKSCLKNRAYMYIFWSKVFIIDAYRKTVFLRGSPAFSWDLLSRRLCAFGYPLCDWSLPGQDFFFKYVVVGKNSAADQQMWWLGSVIPALRKPRQEDEEFESSLDCLARPCLNSNHHNYNSSNGSKSQCFNSIILSIYLNTDTCKTAVLDPSFTAAVDLMTLCSRNNVETFVWWLFILWKF